MGITNLTPHAIIIKNDNGNIITHPSMGNIRLITVDVINKVMTKKCGCIVYDTQVAGISIEFQGKTAKSCLEIIQFIENEFQADEIFIVGTMVARYLNGIYQGHLQGRFVSPNTNPKHVERDKNGQIISVDSLQSP